MNNVFDKEINGELDILDAIDEEILMVLYKDCCIYSQLQSSKELTWEELYGFFA